MTDIDKIFGVLTRAFHALAKEHDLWDDVVPLRCRPLKSEEAIGRPTDRDYPIITGKEAMIEASFRGTKGQAFSDEYRNSELTIKKLLSEKPRTNRERAEFIASMNAVYRHLDLCSDTVHCKDDEPRDCGSELADRIAEGMKVLLVGLQPRLLEFLSKKHSVKVLDLDEDNIGRTKYGVLVSGPDAAKEGIEWCQVIVATGSTIVNGTFPEFLKTGKPVIFYGVTIAAPAKVLKLDRFCGLAR